ncbi:lysylphosphatidylglycerol synthase domain-containing protein [Variovorax sp. CAN2819]|uniref:lysylphosphatidylglycerol synthase domain-containing protein n=1 Tax=Variovorax sp. CAN15 TaxID=3046727 RepID=UPI002647941D|nr:lysylphosphatidylglycerol synthase domain-containing protein [Variovorax sp. CAN15]MDN6882782.1 lysylphosphatidylglycerol synthase domain-containing protein [Variovorax sp. CAN15]
MSTIALSRHNWRPWARRAAVWGFFALIAWLLVRQALAIDWEDVFDAIRALPATSLLAAAALAACSFALYSTYDLLGRRLTRHRLGTPTVMGVTFISYAFNLNLGSLVGGVAFRYRLYSRLGLSNDTITRVLGFSMLTNWLGYLVVAGTVFCFWPMTLPPEWKIGSEGLRILGAVLLVVALAYLVLCAVARGHVWRVRGFGLKVPGFAMAVLQLAMSCANWSLIGGVIWFLLQGQVAYAQVLAVLLAAAVAGVLTHVPAGLGVLEAVFVALLSHEVPQAQLLGALLAYRGLYYLLPLAVAALAYLFTEARARRLGVHTPRKGRERGK